MALQRSWVYRRATGMGEPLTELRRRVYRRSISKGVGVIEAGGLTSGFPPHYSGACLPKIPINGTSTLARAVRGEGQGTAQTV